MTTPRDPDRLIRAALEEGPTVLPDRVMESVLDEVHRSRQRVVRGPWRTMPMSRALSAVAAVIAVIAIGGLALLVSRSPSPAVIGGVATASPATASTASPAAPSWSPAPSLGAKVPGTILFGRRDAAGIDQLYALPPDATTTRQLEPTDSCCIALLPNGAGFVYSIVASDGRLIPAYRALDGSGFSVWADPSGTASGGGKGATTFAGLDLATGAASSTFDIAFEGWDDKDPSRTGIYLSIDDGGGLIWGKMKRLTTYPGTKHDLPLSFSPDGKRLLFIRNLSEASVSGDLYIIGTDGSGLRRLNPSGVRVDGSDAFGPGASWSPDGTRVAFAGFDAAATDGTSRVYVTEAATGGAVAITAPGRWTTSARWSADGAWIAYDEQGAGDHDVFLVHPDGSGSRNLTSSVAPGLCCSQWSPDGTMLLAQSGEPDQDTVDLWVVHTDGSGADRLTAQPGQYEWYVWAP